MTKNNLGYSCRVFSFSTQEPMDSESVATALPLTTSDLLRADMMLDHSLRIMFDDLDFATQHQKRIELLQEAVYLYSLAGGNIYEATANRFLGDLLIAAGRQAEALAPLSRACAIEQFNSRSSPNTSNLTNLACAYYSLAEAYSILGQHRQSEQCYAQSADALEKAIATIDLNRDGPYARAIETLISQMEISDESRDTSTTSATIKFPRSSKAREYLRIRKAWHARTSTQKQPSKPN